MCDVISNVYCLIKQAMHVPTTMSIIRYYYIIIIIIRNLYCA